MYSRKNIDLILTITSFTLTFDRNLIIKFTASSITLLATQTIQMSYKIFLVNSILFIFFFIAASMMCNEVADIENSIYLVFALIAALALSIGGMIIGFINYRNPDKKTRKNEIGLFGNALYCLIVSLTMISAFVIL